MSHLRVCPHCRAELPLDGSFCNACGRRVEGWVKPPEKVAATGDVGSDASSTRRIEPTPSLLRAAAVGSQKPVVTDDGGASDSAVMRPVRSSRTPVVVGAIALLAVGAGFGAYRLLRRPVVVTAPAPILPSRMPVLPPSTPTPTVTAPVAKANRHRRAHRAEPVDVGSKDALKPEPAAVVAKDAKPSSKLLPKKLVPTDSRAIGEAPKTPSPSSTTLAALPADLPSEATPLTDAEQKQQAEASIDADGVRFVIKSHISQVHACYRRFFKDSSPGGRLEVDFVINGQGRATKAKAESNTTGSAELAGCLEARIKDWEFPRPTGGDYELVYPFVFAAGS